MSPHSTSDVTTAIDPVCGMTVEPAQAAGSLTHAGTVYFFCSRGCVAKFAADPQTYLEAERAAEPGGCCGSTPQLVSLGGTASSTAQAGSCCGQGATRPQNRSPARATKGNGNYIGGKRGKYICPMCPGVESDGPAACPKCGMALELATPAAGRKTIYSCPMHPEIEQATPGDCLICGMALEPRSIALGDDDHSELHDMQFRFWVATAFSLPVLLLAMGPMLGVPLHDWLGTSLARWLELLFATPVVLYAGWPILARGVRSVGTGHLNMFTLIALGVTVAYGYSLVATLAPQLFPATFRGEHGMVAVYFEAAAVIIALVLLGQVLELRARKRTGSAIRELLSLAPETARVLREGRKLS